MALEKIGPYEIQGILGRGGMGTVYRGKHRETGEVHAVKVLAQPMLTSPISGVDSNRKSKPSSNWTIPTLFDC